MITVKTCNTIIAVAALMEEDPFWETMLAKLSTKELRLAQIHTRVLARECNSVGQKFYTTVYNNINKVIESKQP